jgi:hypothetical protein
MQPPPVLGAIAALSIGAVQLPVVERSGIDDGAAAARVSPAV